MKILLILSLGTLVILLVACNKDPLVPACDGNQATYEADVKTIIESTCNGGACHGSGSSRGDFTSYSGLLPYLNNGAFKREVIDEQTMPKFKTLSQDEINSIQCWIDNGYAEN